MIPAFMISRLPSAFAAPPIRPAAQTSIWWTGAVESATMGNPIPGLVAGVASQSIRPNQQPSVSTTGTGYDVIPATDTTQPPTDSYGQPTVDTSTIDLSKSQLPSSDTGYASGGMGTTAPTRSNTATYVVAGVVALGIVGAIVYAVRSKR